MTRNVPPTGHSLPIEHRSRFVTTQWQLVKAAGEDSELAVKHLDNLLRLYLPALKAFLTARYGLDREFASDILQEFVASKIVKGNLITSADPDRGRFRTLLLTSLTRHTNSVMRRVSAAKRIPEGVKVPWDSLEATTAHAATEAQQEFFDPKLNQAIVEETLKRFQEHCDRRRKLIMWEVFEGRLVAPLLRDLPEEPYSHLVKRLNLSSVQQASNLLMTAKRSFSNILETVIEEFALNTEDANQELRLLQRYCGFTPESEPDDSIL